MSEDFEFSEDPHMTSMEDDGEANDETPTAAAACGLVEAEGSRIDASKNVQDGG